MRLSGQRVLVYLLLVMFVSVLWFFSPRPATANDYCGRYLSFNDHMGFVVNCDASTYTYPAESPGRLLQKDEVRQSRPLYVLMGTIVGYPLAALARLVAPGADPRAPFHLGFALLNLALLYLSTLLFDTLLTAAAVDALLIVPLAVLLIANDVTKAFVWTAHQQMFSLVTPLVALCLFRRIAAVPPLSRSTFWSLSLALGLLPLVYGNFLIVLPTLLLADHLALRRQGAARVGDLVARYGPAIGAFLVPTLSWVALVTWLSGSYYNHEIVVYRQLIWLADATRSGVGGFLNQAARNTRAYAATYLSVEMFPLVVAGVLLALGQAVKQGAGEAAPAAGERTSLERGCFVVGGCFFLFLGALGYYQTRLTFSLVPLALCVVAMELTRLAGTDRRMLRRLAWVLTPAACLWTAYHLMKYGPFS
jgi:hypothetical protein